MENTGFGNKKKGRIKVLIGILVFAVLVAALDKTGHFFRLYWSLWWFDLIMHFLGGLVIGAIGAWVYVFLFNKGSRGTIRVAILSAIFVGVLWELYEVFIGIQVAHEPYVWDTSIDIIMDILGAFFSGKYIKNSIATVDE